MASISSSEMQTSLRGRRNGKLRVGLHTVFVRYPGIGYGGGVLSLMLLMALLAPWLFTVDPTAINTLERLAPPSAEHWFGTDALGRDLYSRVVYGSRVSIAVGITVAVLSCIIGTFIGLFSGFIRSLDMVAMRVMDAIMSIPPILLAIALMTLAGSSVTNVVLCIVLAEIPRVTRLVRGTVLSLREQLFVEGAIASGSSTAKIVFKHILPNTLGPLTVQATSICAAAMIIEATLSFIGAGTPTTVPSWGNIIAESRTLWQLKPYLIFFPALFLSLTILSVNLMGDGLRDALDPRMSKG